MDTTPKDEAPRPKRKVKPKKKAKKASLNLRAGLPELYVNVEDGEYRAKQFAVQALVKCGNPAWARRMTGISKKTWDFWLDTDPHFVEAIKEATEHSNGELEVTARKRALSQSDYLLVTLLKAQMPEKYRENSRVEHTGKDGGPIEMEVSAKQVFLTKIKKLRQRGMNEIVVREDGKAILPGRAE